MSRFYIPLDKITGTKILPDFSPIISIGDNALIGFFEDEKGLTGSVSFPNLITIGDSGLGYAFNRCTGLTGSVFFPKLTSIGTYGLQKVFYICRGITEVHFKSSLSGNSECTASNMACTNATVYFDLP